MIHSSFFRMSLALSILLIFAPASFGNCQQWYDEDWSGYSSTSDPAFLQNWQGYWTETIEGGLSAITSLDSGSLKLENTSNPYWAGMKRDVCDTSLKYIFDVDFTPSSITNHFVLGIRKFGSSATSYQVAVTFKNGTIYVEDNGAEIAVGSYQGGERQYVEVKRPQNGTYYEVSVNGQYFGQFDSAYTGNTGRHIVFFDHGGHIGSATIHYVAWQTVGAGNDPPDAPEITSLTTVQNTSSYIRYRLSWDPPSYSGSAPIQVYQAWYDIGYGYETYCLTSGTYCEFNLPHSTPVSMRVRAKNVHGWSPYSEEVSITTSGPPY